MDIGGQINSKEEAVVLADDLLTDAWIYGRQVRRVTVVDRRRRVVHERKRRRR